MLTRGWRVLLVGCGELGSRHLQAVARLAGVRDLDVVDPRAEALNVGRSRLAEVPDRAEDIVVRWHTTLEEATPGADLCIVATQAQGRCQLVKRIAHELGIRSFLIEKLIGQSVDEIEDLLAHVKTAGLSVWVNCKTRTYAIHQQIKSCLQPGDPIQMSVIGGNHGLANNGVHAADLFAFYDGAESIEPAEAVINPIVHRTKRGQCDLSGTLIGRTIHGSRFVLSYAGDHDQQELISVVTAHHRWLIDHFQRWMMESERTSGWVWRSVPFTEHTLVSHMTKTFAHDILTTGHCTLPLLETAATAHRFILGVLQPHFSRLLDQPLELCPVS